MSMPRSSVISAISAQLEQLTPAELEALYNRLYPQTPIVQVGPALFEHQDMDD